MLPPRPVTPLAPRDPVPRPVRRAPRAIALVLGRALALSVAVASVALAAPADAIPKPQPERCLLFDPDVAEGDMATPSGLDQDAVRTALNRVIQHALDCGQPAGMTEAHLTFELVIGCDGLVKKITTSDAGGTPETYAACVSAVIAKADFPAHDMENGMEVTYPVNVAW